MRGAVKKLQKHDQELRMRLKFGFQKPAQVDAVLIQRSMPKGGLASVALTLLRHAAI